MLEVHSPSTCFLSYQQLRYQPIQETIYFLCWISGIPLQFTAGVTGPIRHDELSRILGADLSLYAGFFFLSFISETCQWALEDNREPITREPILWINHDSAECDQAWSLTEWSESVGYPQTSQGWVRLLLCICIGMMGLKNVHSNDSISNLSTPHSSLFLGCSLTDERVCVMWSHVLLYMEVVCTYPLCTAHRIWTRTDMFLTYRLYFY